MGKSEAELRVLLPALTALGFPKPTQQDEGYAVSDLLSWVVEQQETNLAIVSLLTEKIAVSH